MRRIIAVIVLTLYGHAAEGGLALEFVHNTTATNATHAQLGDYVAGGYTNFEEVAAGIDARVSGITIGTGHTFDGTFPDYGTDNLGFLYTGNSNGSQGGIQVTIEFFQSDSTVNGITQFATPQTIADFEFMFHDVDGEASQDEYIQAYLADGLYSYQLANSNPLSVANNTEVYQFLGGGVNLDESDASGATILRYINTDSVTFNFFADTNASAPNGVFQALDGDIDTIARADFGAPVRVPEPSLAALMLMLAGTTVCCRRKRRLPVANE